LIPHVIDPKTKPPVAVYSSYRDDDNVLGLAGIASPAEDVPPRFAVWFPLMAYSPEYVAMLAADKVGAEVVFMDLPHYALIRPRDEQAAAEADKGDLQRKPSASHTVEREDDRLIVDSNFYRKLAEVAGYRNFAEAWDTLFEARVDDEDPEVFRRELATFCA